MVERVTPTACPVCTEPLLVTRLSCQHCDTELTGHFRPCPYCAISGEDRALLDFFVASRGNMKAIERRLGVSYPTARGRVDALLERLVPTLGPPSELATLVALARGELTVDEAADRLDSA